MNDSEPTKCNDDTRQSAQTAAGPRPTADGIVAALGERLVAQLDRGSSTLQLALAEMRLATVSAAVLLGLAMAAALLVVVIWLLVCALVGYGLWSWGLAPPWALLVLLVLHGLALAAMAWFGRRLANDLGFAETRRLLQKSPPVQSAGQPPHVETA